MYEFEVGTIHPIIIGYCEITPHGFFQIFPSFGIFNPGMFHGDYFDKYYHSISLTHTGITLLDFFFGKAISIPLIPLSPGGSRSAYERTKA